MNYHNITKDDMLNGDGLRVVLWCSGCEHHCHGCQNPQTWDFNSGISFDEKAKNELFEYLKKDYINGITFSGGDPLAYKNIPYIYNLIKEIKDRFPDKTVWLYTGKEIAIADLFICTDACLDNESLAKHILRMCNVVVDGEYIEEKRDINLKWRGSSNQRVIDIKKSIDKKEIVLLCD